MPVFKLLALTPVTASGLSAKHAAEYARGLLDDNNARLDETVPGGDLATGSVTLLDRDTLANTLKAIRTDAEAVRSGRALTRAVPAARIIGHVETLLALLGESDGTHEAPHADPELLKFLDAAIIRALDLLPDVADETQRAQIGDWITKARAAKDTRNAAQIRALLATPYVQTGGAS